MRKSLCYLKMLGMILTVTCMSTACMDGSEHKKDVTGNLSQENGKNGSHQSDGGDENRIADNTVNSAVEKFEVTVEFSLKQLDNAYEKETQSKIHLSDTDILTEGTGMRVADKKIMITSPGVYVMDGTCSDGQIWVETEQEGYVWLVLNQVNLNCKTGPAIYVENAENTKITLADGTKNVLSDTSGYVTEDTEISGAAIFSRDDLVINGTGQLTVKGNENHGIQSKDDLRIVEGEIVVESVGDGIVGKDSIEVKSPILTITAGGDGMKSTKAETECGYVYLENPVLSIDAECDGIQAETCLHVENGTYTISTGGGSVNASMHSDGGWNENWGNWGGGRSPKAEEGLRPNDLAMTKTDDTTTDTMRDARIYTAEGSMIGTVTENESAKGLKAGSDIQILGGTFELDTSDDALHSNGTLTIKEGRYTIVSGDDGLHADSAVAIDGGEIIIQKSYEGIEGGMITVSAGSVVIQATDDGLNVAGGNDGSSMKGRPGQNPFSADSSCKLIIQGGEFYIDASGDGLDSNGSVEINGGTICLDGPTNGGNGSLDFGTECSINGGEVILTGSAGMAVAPTGGKQNTLMVALNCNAGSEISVRDAAGMELDRYQPAKPCQTFLYSSSKLQQGEPYTILVDGEIAMTITLEETVTTSGINGMSGGRPGGMQGGRPGGQQGGMQGGRPDGQQGGMQEERPEFRR